MDELTVEVTVQELARFTTYFQMLLAVLSLVALTGCFYTAWGELAFQDCILISQALLTTFIVTGLTLHFFLPEEKVLQDLIRIYLTRPMIVTAQYVLWFHSAYRHPDLRAKSREHSKVSPGEFRDGCR